MLGPIARIILRYGAGALAAWGVFSVTQGNQIANDRDLIAVVEVGLGLAVASGTELAYWLAKRWGWAT